MEVQSITIQQATSPKALTMISFAREVGPEAVIRQVFDWLTQIDALSGGKTTANTLAMIAGMVVDRMQYRSVASVLMALRDGFSSTDKDGKIYGSLTWPTVSLWIERHEEKVLAVAHETHASKVVKGDNYGKEWMDEQEQKSTGHKSRQSREIERLRNKLKNR